MKYLFAIIIVLASFYAVSHLTQTVEAADAVSDAMNMTINMGNLDEPKQVAGIVKILLVMTSFTFLPGLLMVMTSFTRIIIVLSFARKALSAQQMPPNQILI